jgi:hypothetical protein
MITIDRNVPIPKFVKEPVTSSFTQTMTILAIGDSFEYSKNDHVEMLIAIERCGWSSGYEKRFVTYEETPYKSRVWRTA